MSERTQLHNYGFWGAGLGFFVVGPGIWLTHIAQGVKEELDWNEYVAIAAFFVLLLSIAAERPSVRQT